MKKIIVFDSSTLILLAKTELLNLIKDEIKMVITSKVEEESTAKKDSFDSKLISKLVNDSKIIVEKVEQTKTNKLIKEFNIDEGEAESLILAKEKNCSLATDDGPVIKICKLIGINFVTAIHFLIRSYEKKLIDKDLALEKLKNLEYYGRYNYDIIKDAKNKIR